ncbi:hypothetical protein ACHAWO_005232 [Cyclotella atomus]|uniref:Integral membrane protein TerC n=1 Tax=Cyclotella atomus TaxID=382360 RepID=A0ABD3P2W3_9STRA
MRSLTKALSAAAAFVLTSQVIAFRPPSQSTICRRTITSSALCATPNEKTAAKNPLLPFDDGFPTIEIEEPPQEDIYKQAISRTILWVGLAAAFGGGLAVLVDPTTSEEFFAGYLVEQSLSVDNLFVFLLLFEYFKVPLSSQDRVLNWGIYGAVVMRAVMIGVGAAALEKFHAILLVFAGILVYSSAKTLIPSDDEEEEEDMNENTIVKFSRNIIDSVDEFDGNKFFTLVDGAKKATPLFICMIALEVSDVVFAVDSIPAVFGVTSNPLVVFTSNMFAIMGLRSLYTILSKAATDLKYLEPAVGIVLGFIGSKMIAEYFGFEIPTEVALGVVALFLSGGVALSLVEKREEEAEGKELS